MILVSIHSHPHTAAKHANKPHSQNGINFGVTFYGLYIVEHYGRRKSLLAGSAWMFICFLIFASVGHFALDREHPQNTEKAATAMICFACFFIFGFATTWGPM
jgi:SP family sugar:H+ symporter-like MFS transporter